MVRQIKIAIVLNIIFLTGVLCWATQRIETQIGPFNLASSPVTEPKIISQFGQGCIQINKIGHEVLGQKHIYYDPDEKTWVEMRFSHVLDEKLERVLEEIFISKQKLCNKKIKPSKPFGHLVTSRGVRLGDSIDKIIKTYGAPSISIEIGRDKTFSALGEDLKLKKGRVLRYLSNRPDDLLFAEFYFDERGLHSLLISASE